jgi:hypothetical protein
MNTIELDTKKAKEQIVIAYDPSSSKLSRKGGDVVVDTGNTIHWQCKNSNESYLVWFYDFTTGAPVWPFAPSPPPDPVTSPPVPGVTSYLRVDSKSAIARVLTTSQNVKYYAMAEHDMTAEWLDPMIIIRPAQASTDSVLFGVTCAVVGAVAGALAMAALS